MRFDLFLTQNGFFESRNKAAAAIKDGMFAVNNKPILKPSFEISERDTVTKIKKNTIYVARSAHKLLRAFKEFDLNWTEKIAADLGASTGGFCQVMLENNVSKIYAVDIGTAQLHPMLKNDPRIINLEHTNARYLTEETFEEPIEVVTADLSFISIKAILPAIARVIQAEGEAIILVKPQFEAGPKALSKSGVVTDRKIHLKVLEETALFAEELGFKVCGVSFSGLAGESGNREYLLYLKNIKEKNPDISAACKSAVYSEESYE